MSRKERRENLKLEEWKKMILALVEEDELKKGEKRLLDTMIKHKQKQNPKSKGKQELNLTEEDYLTDEEAERVEREMIEERERMNREREANQTETEE